MEQFLWRAFEHDSPAALKRLPLKALRYNFQSLWAKCSLAVPALVEIASLLFCRCTQRGSQLRFLASYHKSARSLGRGIEHRQGHLKFRLTKRRSWATGSMLSPTCLGWVESGASAGDQSGEVHSVNTGFVPQHCLSKRKVLISTEVRKECCWPGSCHYLDFCMGIDGEKKMFLQTQPYPLAHFIISFTQSICILYKWCLLFFLYQEEMEVNGSFSCMASASSTLHKKQKIFF